VSRAGAGTGSRRTTGLDEGGGSSYAAASGNHSGQERASHGDHGIDVDGHLVGLSVRVGLGKWAIDTKPGVVDQHLNRAVADVIE